MFMERSRRILGISPRNGPSGGGKPAESRKLERSHDAPGPGLRGTSIGPTLRTNSPLGSPSRPRIARSGELQWRYRGARRRVRAGRCAPLKNLIRNRIHDMPVAIRAEQMAIAVHGDLHTAVTSEGLDGLGPKACIDPAFRHAVRLTHTLWGGRILRCGLGAIFS
jgi:hypothetical protein